MRAGQVSVALTLYVVLIGLCMRGWFDDYCIFGPNRHARALNPEMGLSLSSDKYPNWGHK